MHTARSLDQFYTKPEIARQCWDKLCDIIDIGDYTTILEPSAGAGAFYNLMPPNKRIGIDLDPKITELITSDFLKWNPAIGQLGRCAVVGNPPFGTQSKHAVAFFNHATSFADTIAFIVPITWDKWSVQRRLDRRWKLISTSLLQPNSFTLDNQDYEVRCVFQVWTLRDDLGDDLRVRNAPVTTHPDFVFLSKSQASDADFWLVVCGARKQMIVEPGANIAIQTVERIKALVPGVRERFAQIDWHKYANTNTGSMWINRESIVNEYNSVR